MGIAKDIDRTRRLGCIGNGKKDKSLASSYKEEELIAMLKSCDANRDGRLSKQELKNFFERLGSRFPSWRVYRALHHADTNGDGYISEDEFANLVKYVLKCGYQSK